MSLSHEALLQFLNEELEIDTSEVEPDSPLFSSGIIDSFSLVSLLTYVEKSCGIRISSTDVSLDNFDSIARITSYVERSSGSDS